MTQADERTGNGKMAHEQPPRFLQWLSNPSVCDSPAALLQDVWREIYRRLATTCRLGRSYFLFHTIDDTSHCINTTFGVRLPPCLMVRNEGFLVAQHSLLDDCTVSCSSEIISIDLFDQIV